MLKAKSKVQGAKKIDYVIAKATTFRKAVLDSTRLVRLLLFGSRSSLTQIT
jgi:hypothetical protein